MTQHELLTQLDNWRPWWDSEATVTLMRLAAAEIRRLQERLDTPHYSTCVADVEQETSQ